MGANVCRKNQTYHRVKKGEVGAYPGNQERFHVKDSHLYAGCRRIGRTCTATGETRPSWTGVQQEWKYGAKREQVMFTGQQTQRD